jgi:hypothetical protein
MKQGLRLFILMFGLSLLLFPIISQAENLVYKLDFSGQKNGSAISWFAENGFKLENDGDEIKTRFEEGMLILEVDDDINGLITKQVRIEGATRVRVEWGVNRYLKEANWEKGVLREAIGFIVSFGDEKISSGSFVVPNVPYFIVIFLGQHEIEGKAYLGKYYKNGGRYFCSPCGSEIGQTVITEFDLAETFKSQFGKSTVPFISSFSFEVDARDTDGNSQVFVKSISFISP